MVALTEPGDTLDLVVWRDGKKVMITTSPARTEEKQAAAKPARDTAGTNEPKLGLALRPTRRAGQATTRSP